MHWLEEIDFSEVTIKRSRHYHVDDGYFKLHFNYTDRRDAFYVTARNVIEDKASPGQDAADIFGTHHQDTQLGEWEVLVNAKPDDAGLSVDCVIKVTTDRCLDGCEPEEGLGALEARIRYWSVASDWDHNGVPGHVPLEGEEPVIHRGWNMYYDIFPEQSVVLKSLQI